MKEHLSQTLAEIKEAGIEIEIINPDTKNLNSNPKSNSNPNSKSKSSKLDELELEYNCITGRSIFTKIRSLYIFILIVDPTDFIQNVNLNKM
mgnify:CR=1 FL=1